MPRPRFWRNASRRSQGIGQVSVGGSSSPAVRVELNPTQMNSYGISYGSIENTLRLANAHLALGQISNGSTTADIVANDQMARAERLQTADRWPAQRNGRSTFRRWRRDRFGTKCAQRRLHGRQEVRDDDYIPPARREHHRHGRPRQGSHARLEGIHPAGIEITNVFDRTTTIRASVSDVERSLVLSVILVVLVVFFFLRNVRATMIPSVAVPVSLVGTFAVMYLCGYSLDNLSLMALTISTGFVVDDAIVVMENISRHLEAGMEPMAAALLGAREIGFTVFSISMSLIAVFIPDSHDGRHRRPSVPGIRGHAFHCHPGVDGHLADHHAHDVRASA